MDTQPDRRSFLGNAALASLPLWCGRFVFADETPRSQSPGLIVRESEPENLEFAFSTLSAFTTPNEQFYVRNHFAAPALDVKKWKLKVEGAVETPLELGYEDLLKLKSTTLTATLECAGNGRVFLTPKASGVNWELGAVSNAAWTGVPLASVLEKAGVQPGAVEVVLEGADSGEVKTDPKSPGIIHFARGLPLAKARRPEVLLAHQMNGKELPPSHGYPVRAVVPGWYGMASVKWLQRIVVSKKPFAGYYQSLSYTYFEKTEGLPTLVPIGEMQVKSQIARPALREVVPAGSKYRIFGAAWGGEEEIEKVDVSADGGKTWSSARLQNKAVPFAWRLWEYEWHTPEQAGKAILMSRATDTKGRTQPMQRDPGRGSYMVTHVLPLEVTLR
jgi:DMSO/TMAO reductase YedYZ molybdopterin-dependent catalytic subunit